MNNRDRIIQHVLKFAPWYEMLVFLWWSKFNKLKAQRVADLLNSGASWSYAFEVAKRLNINH